VRGRITVAREAEDEEIRRRALADPKVAEHLAGREVVKTMVIPGRLVSVVVK
jgi:leucyl-tRNA synthetase